jgi:hypothetical protein
LVLNGYRIHVSITIVAQQNDKGVIGVAPEASLLIVKVLNIKWRLSLCRSNDITKLYETIKKRDKFSFHRI